MLLAAILMLTTAGIPPVCSFMPSPGPKERGAPYFLGRALPDTVATGPGAVSTNEGAGHFGAASGREIHGQVIEVSRIGGVAISAQVRAARRVVLVPWDYDAACSPVGWSGSWRWLTPRITRFFHPTLREKQHWVRGLPTYDVFVPQYHVWPSVSESEPYVSGQPNTTAAQLFELYDRMPESALVDSLGMDALAPLHRWADAQPGLNESWPVSEMIRDMVRDATEIRARKLALPMLGTYRIDITLPMGIVRTFYARTASHPDGVATHFRGRAARNESHPDPWRTTAYSGVQLTTMLASQADSLPTTLDYRMRADQPIDVGWTDSLGAWPATIDLWAFLSRMPNDAATDSTFSQLARWHTAQLDAGTMPLFIGAFRPVAEGGYVYRGVWDVGAGGLLTIDATRISPETFYLDRSHY